MAKQPTPPKGNKAKNLGYTSFSEESIAQADAQTTVNQKSYDLLIEALNVPEKARKKNAKGKKVKDDDYYPTSLDETLRMEDLLARSRAALEDTSDSELMDALEEMDGIIAWSKTRQWNFQWAYIAGVLLFVAFLWFQTSGLKDDVDRAKTELAEIRGASDSTLNAYKDKRMGELSTSIERIRGYIAENTASLDTASTRDARKSYQSSIKNLSKRLEGDEKTLASLQSASGKEVLKIAEKDYKSRLSASRSSHRGMLMWTLFFMLLIPLYVFAERPYGYTISRYRLESKILGWIRKVMFWLAGGLFAGAAALQVTETITTTTWSDGSQTKDSSSDAMPILFLKILLIIAAAFIFVFTSVAIMLYSTVVGLNRNYDLKGAFQKLTGRAA